MLLVSALAFLVSLVWDQKVAGSSPVSLIDPFGSEIRKGLCIARAFFMRTQGFQSKVLDRLSAFFIACGVHVPMRLGMV